MIPLCIALSPFDLDGTLVDLRALYVRAHQVAARDVLSVELDEPRVLELMETGLPIRAHMALLDESSADHLVEVFVDCYRRERRDSARPFPGMLETTEYLCERGVPVAVVTSKLRADALAELDACGLSHSVDAVIAFEDTRIHKPHPAPYAAALRALGAEGGVGVGDLPTDIRSTSAAGLVAVGVGWGYGNPRSLLDAGAVFVCDTAAQLRTKLPTFLDRQVSGRNAANARS